MKISKKEMEKIERQDDAIDGKYSTVKANKKKFNLLKKLFFREDFMLDEYLNYLQEAGFTSKPKGWTDNSIKKYSKTFTSKMKGDTKSKGFFDKCVKKMRGKMDNPEGYCASLKDEAYGSTHWRGKDKSKKQTTKDVRTHQNV